MQMDGLHTVRSALHPEKVRPQYESKKCTSGGAAAAERYPLYVRHTRTLARGESRAKNDERRQKYDDVKGLLGP